MRYRYSVKQQSHHLRWLSGNSALHIIVVDSRRPPSRTWAQHSHTPQHRSSLSCNHNLPTPVGPSGLTLPISIRLSKHREQSRPAATSLPRPGEPPSAVHPSLSAQIRECPHVLLPGWTLSPPYQPQPHRLGIAMIVQLELRVAVVVQTLSVLQ